MPSAVRVCVQATDGPPRSAAVQLRADHLQREPVFVLLGRRGFKPRSRVHRGAIYRQFGEEDFAEEWDVDYVAVRFARSSGHAVDEGAIHLVLALGLSRIPVELIAGPLRKSGHALDVGVLVSDAAEDAAIVEVGFVALRLGTKNVELRIDLNFLAGDAKIFEACAEKTYRRHAGANGMLTRNLRHNAVGSENVKNVHAFQHGSSQRDCAETVGTLKARDLGVAALVRNNSLQTKRLRPLVSVSALTGQVDERLLADRPLNRLLKFGAENIGSRVVDVTRIEHG